MRESRGNLSSGASRLKTDGTGTLKKEGRTEIEMLTRMALTATGPQRLLAEPLLRRCAACAWSRNDTQLMAWVLEQAAARGLPLSAFAPASNTLPGQLESVNNGTPPAFIRALLGGGGDDSLAVAFFQCGNHTDWIASDGFDRRVCSRQELHEARERPPCAVSALFSPNEEKEPFEQKVYAALFAALAPASGSELDATGAITGALQAEPTAEVEQVAQPHALHSEVVDDTSLWRVRLRESDDYLCCTVVFRCAVLRGGAEVWVAGCYKPHRGHEGLWTSNATRRSADHTREFASSESLPRKRRTKSQDTVRHQPSAGQAWVIDPVPELDSLHADTLLEQLQATSTDELLCMLDEEPGLGGDGEVSEGL